MLKVVRNLVLAVCVVFVCSFLIFGSLSDASAADVDYIVNVAPSLNITLSTDNVVLDLNPNTKTSDSKDLNIKVSTNNMTGYQLTMSSTGNATDLVRDNTTDGKNAVIPTLSAEAGSTAASLSDNTWGYKKDSGNFIPYVSGTKLLENKYATNLDETTLSFGSKINYNQAAGSYELALVLTGVTNPMMNYMQNLDPSLCTTTPQTVLDIRDMKEYTIARLADGQCWMTSNLNLAGGTTLNAADSDVPTDNYYTLPASSTTGFDDDTKAFVYNSGNETTNQADCYDGHPCNSYYSWLAATAGGKDASGTAVTGDGYNAAYSICPKGWRLPTDTISNATPSESSNWKTGDLYKLATAYGANLESSYIDSTPTFYDNAGPGTIPNFLLAGIYHNEGLKDGGSVGYYWSSTSKSSNIAYYFTLTSSDTYLWPYGHYYKFGKSVRCILNETRTISDITNMQDITPGIVANTTNNATATLTDTRDGQKYTVAKINGVLWMTKNLAIGCNGSRNNYSNTRVPIQLTSADSNVTTAWPSASAAINSVTLGDDFDDPRMECSTTAGAWYNYAAASAGTITGSSNTVATTSDICPRGWRLPTNPEQSGVVSYVAQYNPVLTGYYGGGVLGLTDYGFWWSASPATNVGQRQKMYYYNNTLVTNNSERQQGIPVRCVAK